MTTSSDMVGNQANAKQATASQPAKRQPGNECAHTGCQMLGLPGVTKNLTTVLTM